MKFRILILILITVAFFIPTVSANRAAEDGIGEITVTGEGQNVPNARAYNVRHIIHLIRG